MNRPASGSRIGRHALVHVVVVALEQALLLAVLDHDPVDERLRTDLLGVLVVQRALVVHARLVGRQQHGPAAATAAAARHRRRRAPRRRPRADAHEVARIRGRIVGAEPRQRVALCRLGQVHGHFDGAGRRAGARRLAEEDHLHVRRVAEAVHARVVLEQHLGSLLLERRQPLVQPVLPLRRLAASPAGGLVGPAAATPAAAPGRPRAARARRAFCRRRRRLLLEVAEALAIVAPRELALALLSRAARPAARPDRVPSRPASRG